MFRLALRVWPRRVGPTHAIQLKSQTAVRAFEHAPTADVLPSSKSIPCLILLIEVRNSILIVHDLTVKIQPRVVGPLTTHHLNLQARSLDTAATAGCT